MRTDAAVRARDQTAKRTRQPLPLHARCRPLHVPQAQPPPRTCMPKPYPSTADTDAMVARVAPAILELLADGVPRSRRAIIAELAGRHDKQDMASPSCASWSPAKWSRSAASTCFLLEAVRGGQPHDHRLYRTEPIIGSTRRMILGRRLPRSIAQRLRGWLWPHGGWWRAGHYLLARIRRMPGTPHAIAAGFAAGAAMSMTPFLGGHVLLALALAWATRGNLLAATLGTLLVGNPWALPLILAAAYRLGCFLLGQPPHGLSELASWASRACSTGSGCGCGHDGRLRTARRHRLGDDLLPSGPGGDHRPPAAPARAETGHHDQARWQILRLTRRDPRGRCRVAPAAGPRRRPGGRSRARGRANAPTGRGW